MNEQQYGRKCDLIVADNSGNGLNVSGLSINFSIAKKDSQSPNTAAIRIYNLNEDTSRRIKNEFTRVTLQAGYESNYGVIFDGNIKQIIDGQENGTDTFIDIAAADGDAAYNFAVVNATLGAGATQRDQIEASARAMAAYGTESGYIDDETDAEELPRGKVMYGPAKDYLRQSSETSSCSWSIQDGRIQVVPLTGLLPNQAVVLNSKSGLIGRPEQTNDGVKFRCLLNPMLKIGARLSINEKDIQAAKLETEKKKDGKENKEPPALNADGDYRILSINYIGQTRGNDWYAEGVALNVDVSAPVGKKVQPI